ncbi:MAG: hypothetical protein WBI82_00680 [Sphaerochaeta sp.]
MEHKKPWFLQKFGPKKDSCCKIEIEQIPENEIELKKECLCCDQDKETDNPKKTDKDKGYL